MCCPSSGGCGVNPIEAPADMRVSITKVENGYKAELREDGVWKEYVFVEFMRLALFLTIKLDVDLDGSGRDALCNLVTLNNFNVDKELKEDGGRSRNRRK